MSQKKILFVLTSHDKIDKINKPSGWYSVEAIHPFYLLKKAGYSIDWGQSQGWRGAPRPLFHRDVQGRSRGAAVPEGGERMEVD